MAQTSRPCVQCGADIPRTKPTGAIPKLCQVCKPPARTTCLGCGQPMDRKVRTDGTLGPAKKYCSEPCRPRCSIEGCERPLRKLEWCANHYTVWHATGDPLTPPKYTWAPVGERTPRSPVGPKVEKWCRYCGETDFDYSERKFCSARCRRRFTAGWEPPKARPCQACREEFTPKRDEARYCSITCAEWARDNPGQTRTWPTACVVCDGPLPGTNIRQDTCSTACHGRKHGRIRRERRRGLPFERISKRKLFEWDNWTCHICSQPIDREAAGADGATVDHVIPLAYPGSPGHVWTNVAAAHGRCNSRKRNFPTDADHELRKRLLTLFGETVG